MTTRAKGVGPQRRPDPRGPVDGVDPIQGVGRPGRPDPRVRVDSGDPIQWGRSRGSTRSKGAGRREARRWVCRQRRPDASREVDSVDAIQGHGSTASTGSNGVGRQTASTRSKGVGRKRRPDPRVSSQCRPDPAQCFHSVEPIEWSGSTASMRSNGTDWRF